MEVFAIGAVCCGWFVWKAFTQSDLTVSEFKTNSDSVSTIATLRQYDDVSDSNGDPLNIVSNPEHLKVEGGIERGPFGVPRVKYIGPGGSTIPTFGFNYNKI